MAINELNNSIIERKLDVIAADKGISKSKAFIHFVLDTLFPIDVLVKDETITDGNGDEGIDAIYIEENSNTAVVHIIQTKHTPVFKNCSKNLSEDCIHKLKTFYDRLFKKDQSLLETSNQKINDKVQDIWGLFNRGIVCEFLFYIASNKKGLSKSARQKAEALLGSGDQVGFIELNFNDLCNHIFKDHGQQEVCNLKIIDRQIYERVDGNVKGIIANVEVHSFVKTIVNKSGMIKRYLFDDNIRSYLGKTAGYNTEIKNSALQKDNHLFWYQNNGITIVCDKATYQKDLSGAPLSLTNFKIVNGAQTSFSLVDAYKADPERVGRIVLLLRVYETAEHEIAQKVTIATNSQASIYGRDLRANDRIQKAIQKILHIENIFYQRKRGEFAHKESRFVLDSFKLGQMIMAYKLNAPHKCKTESDQIFGGYYNDIFNGDLKKEYILAIRDCYTRIMEFRELYKIEDRSFTGSKLPKEYYVINYGYWFILSAISLRCQREKIHFPPTDKIDNYIETGVKEVSMALERVSDKSQYNIFRSSRVNDLIVEQVRYKQGDLFAKLP